MVDLTALKSAIADLNTALNTKATSAPDTGASQADVDALTDEVKTLVTEQTPADTTPAPAPAPAPAPPPPPGDAPTPAPAETSSGAAGQAAWTPPAT